jgi:predicted TPR repeat methyltransferase
LISKAHSIDPSAQGLGQDLFRIKSALIGQLEEQAYSQELSGALQDAIATWSKVLEIDPNNIPGQLSTKRLEAQLQPAPRE